MGILRKKACRTRVNVNNEATSSEKQSKHEERRYKENHHEQKGPAAKAQASRRVVRAQADKKKDRWAGPADDSGPGNDQMDIHRGRGMITQEFQGAAGIGGTHNTIQTSSDYMSQGLKTYDNTTTEGYYISKPFLDKLTVHVAKNFMDLPKIKVPLILGVWGGKGQGKTFQTHLAFQQMGVNPIVMSAGELESGNAGEPAKLVRQRYREASDIISKGKMSSLFINDLDAGAGRMGGSTQYTVNNQMVNATLMNIADNPTNVQLPGNYQVEEIPRVPVVATGNDFSTLYAPLIRDGRMEKFYWNPTREDRIGVALGIFKEDNVTRQDIEMLVDQFPGQSIDFFGALRARVYDDVIRQWIDTTSIEGMGALLVNNRNPVQFPTVSMNSQTLMQYGSMLVQEQDNIKRVQLADSYLDGAVLAGSDGSSVPEQAPSLIGGGF